MNKNKYIWVLIQKHKSKKYRIVSVLLTSKEAQNFSKKNKYMTVENYE